LLFLSMVFSLSTSFYAPVFAQSPETVAALKTRLEALERELQTLRRGKGSDAAKDPAATPTPSLEERLEELEAQLRVLARQIEIDKEQAAAAAKSAPVVQAARDGFSFRSADGSFRLRLRGYVQSDGRFFLEDDQRPAVDTFVMRRVRPIVEATLFNQFDFRICRTAMSVSWCTATCLPATSPMRAASSTACRTAAVRMRTRRTVRISWRGCSCSRSAPCATAAGRGSAPA
jgi:hypothetical protein